VKAGKEKRKTSVYSSVGSTLVVFSSVPDEADVSAAFEISLPDGRISPQ